jgi:hypothetical protein
MFSHDETTGLPRGYMLLSRPQPRDPILFSFASAATMPGPLLPNMPDCDTRHQHTDHAAVVDCVTRGLVQPSSMRRIRAAIDAVHSQRLAKRPFNLSRLLLDQIQGLKMFALVQHRVAAAAAAAAAAMAAPPDGTTATRALSGDGKAQPCRQECCTLDLTPLLTAAASGAGALGAPQAGTGAAAPRLPHTHVHAYDCQSHEAPAIPPCPQLSCSPCAAVDGAQLGMLPEHVMTMLLLAVSRIPASAAPTPASAALVRQLRAMSNEEMLADPLLSEAAHAAEQLKGILFTAAGISEGKTH